jgi:anaerobic ribonucleoside-triphosphate reductase activating protein
LAALVRALRARACRHILAYSGYTYEGLRRMARRRPAISAVLGDIDVLIDGPYVASLAGGAGAWTGSANQRVIAAIRSAERTKALLPTCGKEDMPIVWDGRLGRNIPL